MLKKIALAATFTVASIVSFTPGPVNAKSAKETIEPAVDSPVMNGLCRAIRC